MLDYQVLFNGTVGIVGILVGIVLNRVFTALDRLDADVRAIPEDYVSKTDYRDDIKDIKALLGKLLDKLDNKVDK